MPFALIWKIYMLSRYALVLIFASTLYGMKYDACHTIRKKPTEYDLAMYMLKTTPVDSIAHLIVHKMPAHIRKYVFQTLVPNYVVCIDAIKENRMDTDCFARIMHHIEKKARSSQRSFGQTKQQNLLVRLPSCKKFVISDSYAWDASTHICTIENTAVPTKKANQLLHHDFIYSIVQPSCLYIFDETIQEKDVNKVPFLRQKIQVAQGGVIRIINGQQEKTFEVLSSFKLDPNNALLTVQVKTFQPHLPINTRIDTYYLNKEEKSKSSDEAMAHYIMYIIKLLNMHTYKNTYKSYLKKNNNFESLLPKIAELSSTLSYNDNEIFLELLACRPLLPLNTPMPLVLSAQEEAWLKNMPEDLYTLIKRCGFMTGAEYRICIEFQALAATRAQNQTMHNQKKQHCSLI